MKNLVQLTVVQCTPAESYNMETKKMEPKKTKDGQPLFALYFIEKNKKKIGDLEIDEQTVEKINSLISLKPGLHTLEVEIFTIENKLFYRAISKVS